MSQSFSMLALALFLVGAATGFTKLNRARLHHEPCEAYLQIMSDGISWVIYCDSLAPCNQSTAEGAPANICEIESRWGDVIDETGKSIGVYVNDECECNQCDNANYAPDNGEDSCSEKICDGFGSDTSYYDGTETAFIVCIEDKCGQAANAPDCEGLSMIGPFQPGQILKICNCVGP